MASRMPVMSGQAYRAGAFALSLAIGVILAAWAFEKIGRYAPCPLCLQQRYAYYAGIPALFAALVLVAASRGRWAGLLFFAVALGFLANAGLGLYHAGIEWEFWPGPDSCSGELTPLKSGGAGILGGLEGTSVPSCTKALWRFLGLSFAGWNVVASFLAFVAALKAAFAAAEQA